MDKCEAGCKVFTGGEIKHHPDCVFYPESFSKMYDKLKNQKDTDIQEFAEWCSKEGWRYNAIRERWFDKTLYNEKTTSQLLEEWKIWKEEQR